MDTGIAAEAAGPDPANVTTFRDHIDAITQSIAKAQAECDNWKAAGDGEKYLAACFRVEALELQRHERLRRRDR